MVAAILAALGAAVAVIVIVAVVFAVRSRTSTPYAGQKKEVRQLDTVGVGSQFAGKPRGGASSDVRVSSDHAPAKKPSEGLKGRFTAVGVFSAAVFGTLAAKLWSMQILSSSMYAAEAQENLYTTVSTPAPRGFICDADGRALVKNRLSLTVLADPDAADDRDVVQRLSAVLGVPANVVRARMKDATGGAQSQRVVASDVRQRDVAFIAEHADAFPGITVDAKRTVRDYPYGALASHVLGYVGSVSAEQLENVAEGSSLESGDDVGQSGIEYRYDRLLAGDHGQRRVIVDAQGNVVDVVSETQAAQGSDVYLTIKGPVQYAVDRALAALVAPKDGTIGTGKGVAAAAVVMDVRDGSIVAMGSYPTYDPSSFVGSVPDDIWEALSDRRGAHAAAQPRDGRPVRRSVHVQGVQRPCRAQARLRRHQAHLGLHRLVGRLRHGRPPEMLAALGPWRARLPRRNRELVRRGVLRNREGLLLRRRVAGRLAGRHGAAGRHHALPLRGADRHRPAERVGGARADARLEGRGVPQPPRRRKAGRAAT